jgi:hypothetical protein
MTVVTSVYGTVGDAHLVLFLIGVPAEGDLLGGHQGPRLHVPRLYRKPGIKVKKNIVKRLIR